MKLTVLAHPDGAPVVHEGFEVMDLRPRYVWISGGTRRRGNPALHDSEPVEGYVVYSDVPFILEGMDMEMFLGAGEDGPEDDVEAGT